MDNQFDDITRAKVQIENLFGQQVSHEIYQALVEGSGSMTKREATVVALDIRNFSMFAEQHSPSEIMQYQNSVFAPILDIVHQHHGVVNQIMGDGIMATFGAPEENAEHTSIFARIIPEQKLTIVEGLKANGEIVAMTGQGWKINL